MRDRAEVRNRVDVVVRTAPSRNRKSTDLPSLDQTGLDSIAEQVGTIVIEQEIRGSSGRKVLHTDCPMIERKKKFMREIAMSHD